RVGIDTVKADYVVTPNSVNISDYAEDVAQVTARQMASAIPASASVAVLRWAATSEESTLWTTFLEHFLPLLIG
ncbi:unnamed protein product, partial [Amoebophrya sp. A25]